MVRYHAKIQGGILWLNTRSSARVIAEKRPSVPGKIVAPISRRRPAARAPARSAAKLTGEKVNAARPSDPLTNLRILELTNFLDRTRAKLKFVNPSIPQSVNFLDIHHKLRLKYRCLHLIGQEQAVSAAAELHWRSK
jgi:hypothetical protein